MAILIEGYTVVAQRKRIQHLLEGADSPTPNATAMANDHLWRCGFMALEDAADYLQSLNKLGLNISQGPDSDVVLVGEFDGSIEPYCEWLKTAKWDNAVIAWLVGTDPRRVIARKGWDPKVGSGITLRDTSKMEFLRVDGKVEVYVDKDSGAEHYLGRTSPSIQSLYALASKTIQSHNRAFGQSPLSGKDTEQVIQAITMLDEVILKLANEWQCHWIQGKGYFAIGNLSAAYQSFRRAFDLEKQHPAPSRELGGICLEMGKFQEAVTANEHAVALQPDNHELLCNLAVAYLLSAQVSAAQKTIVAAQRFDPSDRTSQSLKRVIEDVATGRRPTPRSMPELQATPKPKKSWHFWKK